MYNSQARQDEFILLILKNKRNGYFLEIGSNHPKYINNTYSLEKNFGWNGLMVEYDNNWESSYKKERSSNYIIGDATQIDYEKIFNELNFPKQMDYLQIDLEVENRSTLTTLELLNNTIFKNYIFSVVTFEHDIYRGNYFDTREKSREIFKENGYVLLFKDVKHKDNKFEDWYIHPSSVNIEELTDYISDSSYEYSEIINILKKK